MLLLNELSIADPTGADFGKRRPSVNIVSTPAPAVSLNLAKMNISATTPANRPTRTGISRPPNSKPQDVYVPSAEAPFQIYGPGMPKADPIRAAVTRMTVGEVSEAHLQTVVDGLRPYGPEILNRLADNGLTVEIPAQGYAHYSTEKKRVFLPQKDLDADTEVPFREYMILHEMAHALDFLWEPSQGPLSERDDLGIHQHRTQLHQTYLPVKERFEAIKSERQRQGRWGPRPDWPTVRVYMEDFVTVAEAVTGERLSERPARGHITILDPETRPTEYFADSVYCYLKTEPGSIYRYQLPTGDSFEHLYPPGRDQVRQRDPKMYRALSRFFDDSKTQHLRIAD